MLEFPILKEHAACRLPLLFLFCFFLFLIILTLCTNVQRAQCTHLYHENEFIGVNVRSRLFYSNLDNVHVQGILDEICAVFLFPFVEYFVYYGFSAWWINALFMPYMMVAIDCFLKLMWAEHIQPHDIVMAPTKTLKWCWYQGEWEKIMLNQRHNRNSNYLARRGWMPLLWFQCENTRQYLLNTNRCQSIEKLYTINYILLIISFGCFSSPFLPFTHIWMHVDGCQGIRNWRDSVTMTCNENTN